MPRQPPPPRGRAGLEHRLGHRFRDASLLEAALTHRSHAHEQRSETAVHYERLEFLGDALLGFLVSEALYRADPGASEGVLSRRRQSLVRASTLAEIAARLGFGDVVRLGRGEEQSGGRKRPALLADTFEAVLGAIYLDGGLRKARSFVRRELGGSVTERSRTDGASEDFKTALQELVQSRLRQTPHYRIVSTTGPDHALRFEIEVLVEDRVLGTGTGPSRKHAEQQAARQALAELQRTGD
jgi:ribonuclease-3